MVAQEAFAITVFWFHWRGWNLLTYTSPNPVPLAFVTTHFFRELKGTFYFNIVVIIWNIDLQAPWPSLVQKTVPAQENHIYSNTWLQNTGKHLGYLGIASSSHKHRCQIPFNFLFTSENGKKLFDKFLL